MAFGLAAAVSLLLERRCLDVFSGLVNLPTHKSEGHSPGICIYIYIYTYVHVCHRESIGIVGRDTAVEGFGVLASGLSAFRFLGLSYVMDSPHCRIILHSLKMRLIQR